MDSDYNEHFKKPAEIRVWVGYVFNLLMCVGAKFIFILPFGFLILLKKRGTKLNLSEGIASVIYMALPPLIILCILSLYSVIAGNHLKFIFFESRDILITLLLLSIMISATKNESDTYKMVTCVERVLAFVGLIKVCMILYCAVTGFSLFVLVKGLSEAMGWTLQSYTTSMNFIARVQFPYDCVIPFILFFSFSKLFQNVGNKRANLLVIALILISVFFTMSRAFWALSLVMILSAVFLNSSVRKVFGFFAATSISLVILYISASQYIDEAINSRLNANTNYASDIYRTMQNNKLVDSFEKRPMLGQGIGYFIPDFLRASENARYTYESQLLSLFMKIGVIGVIAMLGSLIYICFKYDSTYSTKRFKKIIVKLTMIASWLAMGSVNPLLFVTNGAMMLYLASRTNYYIK